MKIVLIIEAYGYDALVSKPLPRGEGTIALRPSGLGEGIDNMVVYPVNARSFKLRIVDRRGLKKGQTFTVTWLDIHGCEVQMNKGLIPWGRPWDAKEGSYRTHPTPYSGLHWDNEGLKNIMCLSRVKITRDKVG